MDDIVGLHIMGQSPFSRNTPTLRCDAVQISADSLTDWGGLALRNRRSRNT